MGASAGTVTITATLGSLSGSTSVTVQNPALPNAPTFYRQPKYHGLRETIPVSAANHTWKYSALSMNQLQHMKQLDGAFLPLANMILAVGLCALGLTEYESDHRPHPGHFYHGTLYYLPPAQIANMV
ncbi:MAG: hypothetical protein JO356_12295 [Acidobacteria bacterium]|nr:hypothetical protein [Acidobacteriota bacterium]